MATQAALIGVHSQEAFNFRVYRYTLSLVPAIVSAVGFLLSHFSMSGAFSGLGPSLESRKPGHELNKVFSQFKLLARYCGRIWSYFDEVAIGGFVIRAILTLVAPALYAASIYMTLGRLIRSLGAHTSLPYPSKVGEQDIRRG
ncbi:hypothetical protein F4677DRAFT_463047 [Hypoxylon crocopeplum]|nr:hypothetical protein F4677DRAFT_463047 [Hypoxylon crocopeplum]